MIRSSIILLLIEKLPELKLTQSYGDILHFESTKVHLKAAKLDSKKNQP